MRSVDQSPKTYLLLVGAASLLVPREFRSDWRREWEAEIICYWRSLEKWGRVNRQTKIDLWKRIRGAAADLLWFQQRRTRLLLVILNLLVAGLTAFGALQQLIVRGFLDDKLQPFFLSLAGIIVSFLFMLSAMAMWLQWRAVRRLVIVTSLLSILVHLYGVLPPHHNMGYVALLVGAGYGLLMLSVFEWQQRRNLIS